MPQTLRPLTIVVAFAVFAAAAVVLALHTGHEDWLDALLSVVTGAVWVVVGEIEWRRRPETAIGPLMVGAGLLLAVNVLELVLLETTEDPGFLLVGLPAGVIAFALIMHVVVDFPGGWPPTRARRRVLVGLYGATALTVLGGVVSAVSFYSWYAEPTLAIGIFGVVIATAAAVVLVLVRARRARGPTRRAAAPMALALVAIVVLGAVAATAAIAFDPPQWVNTLSASDLPEAWIALAVLGGVLGGWLRRGRIASLVVALNDAPSPRELRDALAESLGDRTLELAYWLPERDRYVDLDGRPVALLPQDGRAVTVLETRGVPLAALRHDAALLGEGELVRSATAAAQLALENSRLQAELRAQLLEVRASRTRIVEAADAERRRIERNLHDGTQQRLLGIRFALRLARDRLGEPREADALLADIDRELDGALEELRALARGIHPPMLSEAGLGPALETLARRSALPVQIIALPPERLPESVETAAYFLACEALANATRHAQASHVTIGVERSNGRAIVEIRDDGVGGADTAGGTGLSGLCDRVEALDGSLIISSRPGAGTSLHAEIPCV